MDKKKLLTASLASVAVLGAGFLASNPSVVKAAEDANAAATPAQPAGTTDTSATNSDSTTKPAENTETTEQPSATQPATATEAEKKEFFANFDQALEDTVKELEKADTQGDQELEKQKQETIKKLKEEAATHRAEIEEGFQNGATVADAEKFLEEIVTPVAPVTPAPGAQLERNESGEVTEVKPIKGRSEIDADAQDKINKRLDEEKTDVIDAEERRNAAKDDLETAKAVAKEADKSVAKAQEAADKANSDLEAAKKKVAEAKAAKEKFDKEVKSYADADGEQAEQYKAAAQADLDKATKELEESENAAKALEANLEKANQELDNAKTSAEVAKADIKDREADLNAENERVKARKAAREELAKAEGFEEALKAETLDIKALKATAWIDGDKPEGENLLRSADEEGNFDKSYKNFNEELESQGYTYVTSYTEDSILKHVYRKKGSNSGNSVNKGNSNYGTGFNGVPEDHSYPGQQGDPTQRQEKRPTPGATTPSTPAPETPATPATPAAPSTPAPGTDAPSAPTAETPATPAVAPTVAGTSQDNTYQAPAAKSEDKQELPNTGGKDNTAVAALGFFGLLLGALPFVKRKN